MNATTMFKTSKNIKNVKSKKKMCKKRKDRMSSMWFFTSDIDSSFFSFKILKLKKLSSFETFLNLILFLIFFYINFKLQKVFTWQTQHLITWRKNQLHFNNCCIHKKYLTLCMQFSSLKKCLAVKIATSTIKKPVLLHFLHTQKEVCLQKKIIRMDSL